MRGRRGFAGVRLDAELRRQRRREPAPAHLDVEDERGRSPRGTRDRAQPARAACGRCDEARRGARRTARAARSRARSPSRRGRRASPRRRRAASTRIGRRERDEREQRAERAEHVGDPDDAAHRFGENGGRDEDRPGEPRRRAVLRRLLDDDATSAPFTPWRRTFTQ